MESTRPYRQTARAEAAAQTRQRILAATAALQSQRLTTEVSLESVADEAGVSVATILRRFGSRAELFEQTIDWVSSQVIAERAAPSGDVPTALRILVDHYETGGEFALQMLAQESTYPHVQKMTAVGKRVHRQWVLDVFEPWLPSADSSARDELVDLLVVATDVYSWKLLRKDRGLSRAHCEQRIAALVDAVLSTRQRKDTDHD